jgi:peptidoglycan/xylan/chitin deacetylase (PgdA/CDA1 family)
VVLDRGIVCFSIDLEMAWAWCRARGGSADAVKIALRERDNVPKILRLFEAHHVSATWAVVGHLFLRKCRKESGFLHPHPDMPRPMFFKNALWDFGSGDWYDFDPAADYETAPAWYAPDIIELILKSSVEHEIACHSFSHIGFNEKYCSRELADAELKKCGEAMAGFGIKPVSMVFPGNEAGHFDVLAGRGFRAVRFSPRRGAEVTLPMKISGQLWAVQESANIVPDDEWSSEYILWRLKKYVDAATGKKALCHFWFHPSIAERRIKEVLLPILEYCAEKRDQDKVDIMTMREISELMECRFRIQDVE